MKYKLSDINNIFIKIKKGDIIFLNGDLAAGKTTLSKHIINNILKIEENVTSPTYVYYNKYGENIYHFDLYRLKNYDEFFSIGAEDILDDSENIILIEWPDIISKYYKPNIIITIKKLDDIDEREIIIDYL